MTYHVGNLAKTGGRLAYTVQQDGVGYHIAECRFSSSAELICKALNHCSNGGAGSSPSATTQERNK